MWRHCLLAFRPKTLTAALVPVMVGTALVAALGFTVQWSLTIYALLSATLIQIGTNLFNDAIDFKKGADTEERIGPQRVTQSGLMSPNQVYLAAGLSFFLALIFGIPLVYHGGVVIVAIGLISLAFGYAYTGGPFPLAYLGLGDLFVVLFFGLVAVGGVFYLHTGTYGWPAVVAGLQVGLLATVLIAINNLRDREQDQKANKKTLAVRFGETFARNEILFLLLVSFGLNLYWAWQGQLWAALLPLVILPASWSLMRGLWQNRPSSVYNQYLAKAALVHLIFGLQLSIGLLMS